jgi:hypothetical protein
MAASVGLHAAALVVAQSVACLLLNHAGRSNAADCIRNTVFWCAVLILYSAGYCVYAGSVLGSSSRHNSVTRE